MYKIHLGAVCRGWMSGAHWVPDDPCHSDRPERRTSYHDPLLLRDLKLKQNLIYTL